MAKPLDDRNLVTAELIRKVLLTDVSATDCTKDVLNLESSEPLLYEAMTDLVGSCTQGISEGYPLVKRHHPRILQDFVSAGQVIFIRGFTLGKQLLREFFEGGFDDPEREDCRPETDPKNFR